MSVPVRSTRLFIRHETTSEDRCLSRKRGTSVLCNTQASKAAWSVGVVTVGKDCVLVEDTNVFHTLNTQIVVMVNTCVLRRPSDGGAPLPATRAECYQESRETCSMGDVNVACSHRVRRDFFYEGSRPPRRKFASTKQQERERERDTSEHSVVGTRRGSLSYGIPSESLRKIGVMSTE